MDTENLKEYYKEVKKCKRCERRYGIDRKEYGETKDLCPLCIKKLKEKKIIIKNGTNKKVS